jgi:hypothetical protein
VEINKRYVSGARLGGACLAGFLALAALAVTGCQGKHSRVTVQNEEQDAGPRMVSTIRMNDAKADAQLLSGFHSIENNSWRWTAGKFSVLLRTPLAAAQRGATLTLAFNIPDLVIQKLKSITLTASIDGMALNSAEYKAAGPYVFSADVPLAVLKTESVKIDFALDKSLPPGIDKRELGIVATSVGLAFLFWFAFDGLKTWFVADDFAWLGLIRNVHSLRDILTVLFAPAAQGTVRPWSERGFFLLFESLFGLDSLPFRICVFVTVAADIALVSWLARRIAGSRVAGFLAPILWTVNTALVTVLSWSSAYNEALCSLFLLVSIACFIRYVETGRRAFWWLQLVVFTLGFGALEVNVVYPALAAAYIWFEAPAPRRRRLLVDRWPLCRTPRQPRLQHPRRVLEVVAGSPGVD